MHQYGHCGMAATAAKTKQKFWILHVHDLAKRIQFQCVFCREMELKAATQVLADLPTLRLTPWYQDKILPDKIPRTKSPWTKSPLGQNLPRTQSP